MKNLFLFLLSVVFLSSCDDGDIIITSFEFDDVNLEVCDGADDMEFVFFKINTTNNEAISLNFIGDFNENKVTDMPITINLAEDPSSSFIYRQFNVAITNDYYCSNVPASNIMVTDELLATSGIAEIVTQIVEEDDNDNVDPIVESGGIDPVADADGDEIPNYQDSDNNGSGTAPECTDTDSDGICDKLDKIFDADGDGIPNYKDPDDDDDNILTSAELGNLVATTGEFLDSDGDGTPDYLDSDDDNDGIPTLNEDIDNSGSPRDDDTDGDDIDNYLDPDSTERNDSVIADPDNTDVRTTFRTTVEVREIVLNGESQNFEEGNNDFSFGFSDSISTVKATKN